MSGPVGGAGELTALELAQRVINNFRQYAANGVLLHPIHYLPMAEALEFALAAKAPQGVPTRQQFERELYASDEPLTHKAVMRIFDSAVTAAVPSPVSDDTIHHGMVPPADEYNLRAYKVEGHWYVDIDIDKAHSGLANGVTLSEAMDSASEMLRHMRNKSIEEGRLPREAAAPKPAPSASEDELGQPFCAKHSPKGITCACDLEREGASVTFEKPIIRSDGVVQTGWSSQTISSGMARDLNERAFPAPGAERLREALEKIIEMNRQTALDKYGDAETAESWSCVTVAREALATAPPAPVQRWFWDKAAKWMDSQKMPPDLQRCESLAKLLEETHADGATSQSYK